MPVHQLEHELSGMDDRIAHGAGLSARLASWARYVYQNDVNRFAQYAVNVWNQEMDFEHPERTAQAGIRERKITLIPGYAGELKGTGRGSCIL